MKTINSLSGGATSSFMASHFTADEDIFALVCVDDNRANGLDPQMMQYINDKLEESGTLQVHGEFIATAESDQTLYAMRSLEQHIGRSITWLRGSAFDQLIAKKKMVPSQFARFCTTELKIIPMATYIYHKYGSAVIDNIGIRYDEQNRVKKDQRQETSIVIGTHKNGNNKWLDFHWGNATYPLVYDMPVTKHHVVQYWKDKHISFPVDSNCVGCFHKPLQQLRKNLDRDPVKMQWFIDQQFNLYQKGIVFDYKNLHRIALQADFFDGTGAGCQSNFCTD